MGFKVDVKELTDYKQDIDRSSSNIKEQIDGAISSMRAIPSSQSMDGKVGQAVGETITANHIPSLIGLKSSYDQLSKAVTKTLSDFKNATGETSASAVITEDVLKEIPSKLDTLLNNYNEGTDAIKGIYASISDLVSLSLPKSNLEQTINKTKEQVKQIQEKVRTFDSGAKNDEIGTLLSQIDSQINRITSTKSLSYGNSDFLAFSNRNDFVSTMAQAEAAMSKEEKIKAEKLRKQKEADWNRLDPYSYYLKYPEDRGKSKHNFNHIANSINGTISNVDMTGLGKDILQDSYMGFGEKLLEHNGSSIAYGFSNIHVNNVGTPLGSAAYIGQQGISHLGTTMTGLGIAIDMWQLKDDNDPMAVPKITAHAVGGITISGVIGSAVTTALGATTVITLPAWGTVAAGIVVGAMAGVVFNNVVDFGFDAMDNIFKSKR